jgi:hypothetical protein
MSLTLTPDGQWRNRAEIVSGGEQIEAFLTRKWLWLGTACRRGLGTQNQRRRQRAHASSYRTRRSGFYQVDSRTEWLLINRHCGDPLASDGRMTGFRILV